MDKVAAYHETCSTLASLTVHGNNIVTRFSKEAVHTLAKWFHQIECARVMVIKPKAFHVVKVLGYVVLALIDSKHK